MSAKSAVTVLRSPARFSEEGTSIIEIEALFDLFAGPVAGAIRAVPHFLQNRAPGLTAAWHVGHKSSSFAPHCSQKAASAVFAVLQVEQSIALRVQFFQQRLGIPEVGGIKTFSEPLVDVSEHHSRLVATVGGTQ